MSLYVIILRKNVLAEFCLYKLHTLPCLKIQLAKKACCPLSYFRIKYCLDQREQAAVCKSRIVDCGKDKFITEIPEQEQYYQYDTYPVKNAHPFASLFGRKEPAV
jgi:hypothetical protein